tara:strand:+ start:4544 stop:5530 length:987 start_codon:yes stop_codon:yes gene_type:complete
MTQQVLDGSIAIEVDGLTKRYDTVDAISGISFQIKAGEIFGLLGPNGAGKTTTTRILITILKPTSGTAKICGHDIVDDPAAVRQIIGYVPQERAIDRFLTGREHLLLLSALYHLPKHDTDRRIDELLKLVNLEEQADHPARNYSGGMKRKLDIACGLIPNPKVLFLDEPTLGLDVESRFRIWEHVRALKEQGITIVMTTNYLDEADQLCDRIAVIDGGHIRVIGAPAELKSNLGGDLISVTIGEHEQSLDALTAALKAVPGVRKVDAEGTRLQIFIETPEKALSSVLQSVMTVGHRVESIDYHRPRLDDVFVAYTGHQMQSNTEYENK